MSLLLGYLAGVLIMWPIVVRDRYHRLRASHPHTHPRDVRYDIEHALLGSWRALLWAPYLGWLRRSVVWVGWRVIGKARVADHVRAARVEMWEAELATTVDPAW